jgi:hypothetical protein
VIDPIAALLEHPEVSPLLPGLAARGVLEVDPGTYASFCEVCSQLGLEGHPGGVPGIVEALRVQYLATRALPSSSGEVITPWLEVKS